MQFSKARDKEELKAIVESYQEVLRTRTNAKNLKKFVEAFLKLVDDDDATTTTTMMMMMTMTMTATMTVMVSVTMMMMILLIMIMMLRLMAMMPLWTLKTFKWCLDKEEFVEKILTNQVVDGRLPWINWARWSCVWMRL